MSLRRLHEIFMLVAIVMAEMFGGWALHDFQVHRDPLILTLGLGTLVGGLVVALYVFYFEREMDREGLR